MAKKTILCAIDFSESSLNALKWTMTMAQMYDAQVTFLFCYRLIPAEDEGESLNMKQEIEANALNQFQKIERKSISSTSVPYQFITEVGFFSTRIEAFVKRSQVDLLVVGNDIIKKFNEYKNLSFDQFVCNSKIPVLVVPENVSSKP